MLRINGKAVDLKTFDRATIESTAQTKVVAILSSGLFMRAVEWMYRRAERHGLPLAHVNALAFFDSAHVKIRDEGLVHMKAAHVAWSFVTMAPRILGFWVETNERASF